MLVLHPIGEGQSRYYLEGPAPGRWIGGGSDDLGLRGPVDEASLHAVLGGRRPGGELLLGRISATRRSGFDLILAAPKSVSLVAALAGPEDQARFRQAHQQAVGAAVGYLERHALWTRRGAEGRPTETTGLVAASFGHERSATHDPHLHSHVVVANLVHGDDGRWSSIYSRLLYRHASAAGALYHAGLRHGLAELGLRFDWSVNRHGLGDIVGVPRTAIDAGSRRHQAVLDEVAAGLAGRRGRTTAAGRTRRSSGVTPDPGDGAAATGAAREAWRGRVASAGLDQASAQRLVAAASAMRRWPTPVSPGRSGDDAALARHLGEQHSSFRRPDVVQAAATLSPAGAPAAELEARADAFLQSAISAGDDVWTTADLRRQEERIAAMAVPTSRSPVGLAGPGHPPAADLSDAGRAAVDRLTRGGAPVDLLRGDLISQAQVLDAAREAWEGTGHQVALMSRTERGQARWQTLAGLEPAPARSQATVVVVDNADRWSTTDLHRVMTDATARQAKVVLLDGGTLPSRHRAESPAMDTLRTTLVPVEPGASRAPDRPAGRVATGADVAPPPPRAVVPAGRGGSVIVAPTRQSAMDELLGEWRHRRAGGERPRMVALGPEEAEHLNGVARALRAHRGELSGPTVTIGGRPFQAGDEVMALRRDPRLGGVPGGTLGRVNAVDPDQGCATVEWQGRDAPVTVTDQRRGGGKGPLAHGYATTPPYLRAHTGPVLSLGPVEAIAPAIHPDRVFEVVSTATATRQRDTLDPVAKLLAEAGRGTVAPDAKRHHDSHDRRLLSELVPERDRLAQWLQTSVPPDQRSALRRIDEERAWMSGGPASPTRSAGLRALDDRRADLVAATGARAEWLEDHRDALQRWSDLTTTIGWREAALGRGAEIRPTAATLSELGPPPPDDGDRPAWRRAAGAIEAHRERWSLADAPLGLSPTSPPAPDLERRADELRVLAATREVHRSRGRQHSLAPGGP